jgi:hypothetical protein
MMPEKAYFGQFTMDDLIFEENLITVDIKG